MRNLQSGREDRSIPCVRAYPRGSVQNDTRDKLYVEIEDVGCGIFFFFFFFFFNFKI